VSRPIRNVLHGAVNSPVKTARASRSTSFSVFVRRRRQATVKIDSYRTPPASARLAGTMKSLIVLALLVLSTLTVNAQKVKVSSDPACDFSKYKTYTWDQGTLANPIIKQYIVAAVDKEMAAKGLRKVENDADLTLTSLTATESDLTATNPSWAPALNSIATGIPASSQAWAVTKGTLMIDMTDARTKNGVWRGVASHTLENGPSGNSVRDAKAVEKPINKAVQKMFKKFPPQSKS